jgi:Ca2+-transporting ATPase
MFARQFLNTMTGLLSGAALVSLLIGDRKDAAVIAVIVVVNGIVAFVQEHRAEQAMAALEQLATTTAQVVRDGTVKDIPSNEVVPGDLLMLAAGQVVAADLRLVDVHGLRVDEAPLTGESEPTAKSSRPLPGLGPSLVADRLNMAFKGTAVTFGRASGIAVATGRLTELGRIAALMQMEGAGPTPLQRRLAVLGRRLAGAALIVCGCVFVGGLASGEPAEEMFLIAVSLAVAAIPEGLPAVVTVALALGGRRMADRRALVRRLPAVETLGSVSVICTDKTGTLTENRMMVERIWTPGGSYTVSGSGYRPDGEIHGAEGRDADPHLERLARVAAACNDAVLHAPQADDGGWTITGDPTEGALLTLAGKLGIERADLDRELPRIAEIGFDASRRRMTTAHRQGAGYWITVKGALDALAPLLAPEDGALLAAAEREAHQLADDGYRVLALAERDADALPDPLDGIERGARLIGLVGIADPPRPGASDAIAACRAAGITTVMITGDHPRTARAVAHRLGMFEGDDVEILTGVELDALDDEALASRIAQVQVFARTNPEQKLRIVNAWKTQGAIVAMTGDGVNDAPALRRADIGVAMGRTGTDVSREAADMVLADDDFATIVHAVEEGRRIYDNVRRFVRYLLTTNSGEIWVMFLAPLLGLPLPLLPIQILWINLVTDGLPAVALGLEPAEPDTMRRPPRPPDESILAGGLWQRSLAVGLLMAAVTIALQAVAQAAGWPWRTMVFTTLALLQLGNALAVRSERHSFFALGRGTNRWITGAVVVSAAAQLATVYVPALQDIFETRPLSPLQLAVVVGVSTSAFAAVEVEKWIHRRAVRRPAQDRGSGRRLGP